jgi:hypothetical protein
VAARLLMTTLQSTRVASAIGRVAQGSVTPSSGVVAGSLAGHYPGSKGLSRSLADTTSRRSGR